MPDYPVSEGRAPLTISGIEQTCYTYYKVVGDLSAQRTPLILIHGGSSAGHEYLLAYTKLWTDFGIPLVFYDQIGCASSTHLPDKEEDGSFWSMDHFLAELDNLIDHVGIRKEFDILGQSWGAMVGPYYASRRPQGLRRLVLQGGLASWKLGVEGYTTQRDGLDDTSRLAMIQGLKDQDFKSEAYKAAAVVWRRKHVYRGGAEFPPDLLMAFKNSGETRIHPTMLGPTLFQYSGALAAQEWTVIPGLPNITARTLVIYGEYDCSQPSAQAPFVELIPDVTLKVLPDAGHFIHVEPSVQKEAFDVIGRFLTD